MILRRLYNLLISILDDHLRFAHGIVSDYLPIQLSDPPSTPRCLPLTPLTPQGRYNVSIYILDDYMRYAHGMVSDYLPIELSDQLRTHMK